MRRGTIHLNPLSLGKRSKTGELDESVMIQRPWLARCVAQWAASRRQQEPLFAIDLATMRGHFLQAAAAAGMRGMKPVLYMGRHSGASLMILEKAGTLVEVKQRGRWRSDASIRRYEKSGLIQKAWLAISEADRRRSRKAAARLPGELARHCAGIADNSGARGAGTSLSTSSAVVRV